MAKAQERIEMSTKGVAMRLLAADDEDSARYGARSGETGVKACPELIYDEKPEL